MQITTIKLQKTTKATLDNFKTRKESYDFAIKRLLSHQGHNNLKSSLIEAYKNMGKDDLSLLAAWEPASHEVEHD